VIVVIRVVPAVKGSEAGSTPSFTPVASGSVLSCLLKMIYPSASVIVEAALKARSIWVSLNVVAVKGE